MTTAADYSLRTSDVAQRLGVTPDAIVKWSNKGLLPFIRTPGRQRRFRQADIDAFAAQMADDGEVA